MVTSNAVVPRRVASVRSAVADCRRGGLRSRLRVRPRHPGDQRRLPSGHGRRRQAPRRRRRQGDRQAPDDVPSDKERVAGDEHGYVPSAGAGSTAGVNAGARHRAKGRQGRHAGVEAPRPVACLPLQRICPCDSIRMRLRGQAQRTRWHQGMLLPSGQLEQPVLGGISQQLVRPAFHGQSLPRREHAMQPKATKQSVKCCADGVCRFAIPGAAVVHHQLHSCDP
mmetsp:Transcript_471/g.1286  ORF Transcript_471/g.1286 Transcript_471/m.1286 type:complete len:224 (-) Transcript_471:3-674(-)